MNETDITRGAARTPSSRMCRGLFVILVCLSTSVEQARGQAPQLPLAPLKTVSITTDEGTWMSLDVSPDGKTIAFELLGNLFTVPIGGGRARQLTEGPAWNERPQYSPDGRTLYYTSDQSGYNEVWQIPVAGGTPMLVPGGKVSGYYLAPDADGNNRSDSAEVGVVYRSPGGRYEIRHHSTRKLSEYDTDRYFVCEGREFLITDAVAGTERQLRPGADCGADRLPASSFTPDGQAFITSFGGKLRRIAVPSGATTVIPFTATVRLRIRPMTRFRMRVSEDPVVHARRIAGATLSPDGSKVAFSAFSRIYVAPTAGGAPKRLTTLGAGEFWPAWSPDGRYVAFVTWTDSVVGGEGSVYRMHADGGGNPGTADDRVGCVHGPQLFERRHPPVRDTAAAARAAARRGEQHQQRRHG